MCVYMLARKPSVKESTKKLLNAASCYRGNKRNYKELQPKWEEEEGDESKTIEKNWVKEKFRKKNYYLW